MKNLQMTGIVRVDQGSVLAVRNQPNFEAEMIGTLKNGLEIQIECANSEFYKMSEDRFVAAKFVELKTDLITMDMILEWAAHSDDNQVELENVLTAIEEGNELSDTPDQLANHILELLFVEEEITDETDPDPETEE